MSKEILHEATSASNIIPLFSEEEKQRNDAINSLNFQLDTLMQQAIELACDIQKVRYALKDKKASMKELKLLLASIDNKYYYILLP